MFVLVKDQRTWGFGPSASESDAQEQARMSGLYGWVPMLIKGPIWSQRQPADWALVGIGPSPATVTEIQEWGYR